MKFISSIVIISFLFIIGCAPKVYVLTPQGKIAYTADQIAKRNLEFQNVIIQAEANGGISLEVARPLVQTTVSLAIVLHDTPDGWQITIKNIWSEAKKSIPMISNPIVKAAYDALDIILMEIVK